MRAGPALVGVTLLGGLFAGLSGCASNGCYIFRQAVGQIGMLLTSVPIDTVLARDTLDPEQQRKLSLIVAARDFAGGQLGLRVGNSFTLYHDTSGNPIAYNLSAARQDALVAKSWTFPIIGKIDYLGFFARADADAEAANLQKQGYDTYIYSVDAYSTLGYFPDPVQSAILKRPDGSLVETVIHELAHNTVYANGQSTFNESMATFIGRLGVRLFYVQQGAAGQQVVESLEQGYADQALITDWVMQLEEDLRAYYAQDLPSDVKIAGREAIFQAARERFTREVVPHLQNPAAADGWARIPTNNAFILLNRRYNLDLSTFAAAYERAGQDFPTFLNMLRAAAATPDPFAALAAAATATQPAGPQ